jgi:CheY-like chemotaxis protein
LLLVEDDEVDAMNVQRAFRGSETVTVVRAGDGVDALEMLRTGNLSRDRLLIVLDLHMPRMNGIEFLREVRGDPDLRRLPVVMLTTSDDEQDVLDAYDLNVAGYLIKPATREQLFQSMKLIEAYWTALQMP